MNISFLVSLGHLSHTFFSPNISTKVVTSSKGQLSKAQGSTKLKVEFLVEQRSSWLLLLGALGKEESVRLKNRS